MDKAAYIERLEAAILQSSKAMTILREENVALQEQNKQLQQRNIILEAKLGSASNGSQHKTSIMLSARNKRSFAGGLKKKGFVPPTPESENEEPEEPVMKKASKLNTSSSSSHSRPSLIDKSKAVFKVDEHEQQKEKGGGMTCEEQKVADAFDKDFDEMSSSSESGDENDTMNDEGLDEIEEESYGDSDYASDDGNESTTNEIVSTTQIDEDNEDDEENYEESRGPSFALQSQGKRGVKGHGKIDVSTLEHSNLQILFILEHLTMDNVHTASLLLCKYSHVPVCEILCKYIKTVGKAEVNVLLKQEEKSTVQFGEGGNTQENTCNMLSSTCKDFLERIVALLSSIAAREVSNGPDLCRQMLYMMHDNLWLCWFPKDSLTNTAGWKKEGIFDLQKLVFFGCGDTAKNVSVNSNNPVGGDCSSDVICEMFASILITVAFQQGLFPLVEAVLRSYVYVSQNLASLGTSVGLLNAFILNGNISFGNIPQDSTGQFQSNGFVNDLLLKWNTCNMCIITETIANTIKLNIDEALTLKMRIDIVQQAQELHEYCKSITSDTQEHCLVYFNPTTANPLAADDKYVQKAYDCYLQYIKSSYLSSWNIFDESTPGGNFENNVTMQSIISKWKISNKSTTPITINQNSTPSVKLQYKRFSVDMFLPSRIKSTGLWHRILHLERKCTETSKVHRNMSGSMFSLLGIANVDTVVSNLLYLDTQIGRLSHTDEGHESRSIPYVEVFEDLLRPCANAIETPKQSFRGIGSNSVIRSILPTLPGIENYTIQVMCTNWTNQLDALTSHFPPPSSPTSGYKSSCSDIELAIVQRLHAITTTLKNGTVPLYFETAHEFKKTNYEYLIQDSFAKCKMILLQQQLPVPSVIQAFDLQSAPESFSSLEMFQAISIPPALMRNSIAMLNHCLKYISESEENRNQLLLQNVVELASNLTNAIYEMLVFMTISSLRALLQACRRVFLLITDSTQHEAVYKRVISQALLRVSQECIMILLTMHHTSYFSFNKSYILFDISKTLRCFGDIGTTLGCSKLSLTKKDIFTFQLYKALPFPITKWLWEQTFRKVPAFVINLDVREIRWTKLLRQCSRHGILPIRVAAVDARKGLHPSSTQGEENAINSTGSLIPPEVVTMNWDSTVNATFDTKCFVNVATPMTASERACAVSHVMIWKLVYEIFANKSLSPSSELAIFLSSLSSHKLHDSRTTNTYGVDNKKSYFKALPSPHVYDMIPKIWLSQPQPQYQKLVIGEKERVAELNDVCSLFALWNHSRNFEYYGKGVLILEDDASIDPHPKLKVRHVHPNIKKLIKKDFLHRMTEIEEKIPSDFDICYLGYTGKTYKNILKKALVRPQYVWQLHAYLLSPKGAAKLLSYLPVSAPVDNFVAKLIVEKKLEAYAVPMDAQLIKQGGTFAYRKSTSDIVHSSSTR